ncbi:MAG: hypothetical protein HY762_05700 [Planctomycetes bacterium]|nr:hypothetical protein [Planctomycetota bacterium]
MKQYILYSILATGYSLLAMTGCAGPTEMTTSLEVKDRVLQDIKASRQVPHRVVVAPVTVDKPPAKVDDKTEKYFTLNPEAMANELTVAFRTYGVFDKIEVLPETVTKRKDQIKEARKDNATHIMYVTVKQYRIYYIGNSSATMSNTFLWFFGGIPSFFTHDQMYGVQMKAHITYLDVATSKEFALPGLTYDAEVESSGSLSFLERGFNIAICIMPPQWCSVNWDKVEKLIRPNLMKHLMAKLAEQTKSEFSRSR